MQQRTEEMHVRLERTRVVIRRELERRYPELTRQGLALNKYVWIAVDEAGNVRRSGILDVDYDRTTNGVVSWGTSSVERQIRSVLPGTPIANVHLMMGMEMGPPLARLNAALITVGEAPGSR
jgi:hypothetical protein